MISSNSSHLSLKSNIFVISFLIEMKHIFEMVIHGSNCVSVSNVSENSEIHLFLDSENDSESDEEEEFIVSKIEEIRTFLKLGSGSRPKGSSSSPGR
jgi:hypothetical protein